MATKKKKTSAKAAKKGRVKVGKLKGAVKGLSAKEQKKVKGGLLPAVRNVRSQQTFAGSLGSDTFAGSLGSDTFASSFGSDSIENK